MRILEIIDTLENQGVFLLPAKNDAGHTREYAQHDDSYQCLAFHSPKGTNNFWSSKLLSQIFHQNFRITAVTQLGNALFANLTDAFTGET